VAVFPLKGVKTRLRDFPFIKIFLVVFVWSCTTFFLPFFQLGNINFLEKKDIWFGFISRFLFIFSITIPFDIRDRRLDVSRRIKTFPVLYGVQQSKNIALISLVGCTIASILFFLFGEKLNQYEFTSLIVSLIITAIVILFTNEKRSEYFFDILVEGTIIIQFLLVWMGKNS